MLIKNKLNNKGVSLVEVIVSVALLTIISVTFLDILTGSFSNTMNAGRENKEFYKAAGEMDIAIRDVSYTGKNSNVFSGSDPIVILGETINTRLIYSKTENLDSSIDILNDPYISAYVVDEYNTRNNEAYIDVNNNASFDFGTDLLVTAEQLDGPYIYLGNGPLIIPLQESIYDPMTTVDWYVKDGIHINSGINITSSSEIRLKSVNGNLILNELNIVSVNGIIIESQDDISLIQSTVQSSSDSIEVRADNADITGIDSDHMKFEVALNQLIDFYVNNTITMSNYTKFIEDGNETYAHNIDDATLNTANDEVSGTDEFK